jgi:hypothetical protein
MNGAEAESAPERAATDAPQPAPRGEPEWLHLLQLSADVGADLGQLALLEVRLALTSLSRMLLLAIAFLPLALLAWLGLSGLPAVLCYEYSGSVTLGLLVFLALQLLALWALCASWMRYRRTLGLPRTRRQLQSVSG